MIAHHARAFEKDGFFKAVVSVASVVDDEIMIPTKVARQLEAENGATLTCIPFNHV